MGAEREMVAAQHNELIRLFRTALAQTAAHDHKFANRADRTHVVQ